MTQGRNENSARRGAEQERGGISLEAASPEWLAARARDGGDGAVGCFSELIKRYEARVYTFVSQRVPRGDAEDVTQEAFLRAWRSLGRYDETRRFGAWLFTIAARAASDHRRGGGRRRIREAARARADLGATVAGKGAAASDLSERARGAELWRLAAEELTGDAYSALWLRYAEGLAPAEIAKALGRSGVWVRVSLFRARATLEQRARERGLVEMSEATGTTVGEAS